MGAWYTIGLFAGLGAAAAVLLAALLAPVRFGALLTALPAAAAAAGTAFALGGPAEAAAGATGAVLGAYGASDAVRGTLRRGGTRAGTAVLVAGTALALAALSLVPVAGYLVALAVPALGLRMRRRTPERYAGLRTLARD